MIIVIDTCKLYLYIFNIKIITKVRASKSIIEILVNLFYKVILKSIIVKSDLAIEFYKFIKEFPERGVSLREVSIIYSCYRNPIYIFEDTS